MSWCRKCGYGSEVCRISSFSGCPQCGAHELTSDNPFGRHERDRGPSRNQKATKARGSNYSPEELAHMEAEEARKQKHREVLLAKERAEMEEQEKARKEKEAAACSSK